MRFITKPVRKCYPCLLNLGDHCWLYAYPRGQWRSGATCSGFNDQESYQAFEKWSKGPTVKSRKEIRREFFRRRKRKVVSRLLRR